MSLDIHHLTVAYGEHIVIVDLSLVAYEGEIIGLIGANGAGKTTLIRAISGLVIPSAGAIHIGEADLRTLSIEERARKIAVVPQSVRLPEAFTALEVVLMGRTPHLPLLGRERDADYLIAYEALERTGTLPLADTLIGKLSGGEQQRVLIARALAQEPRVLLLDEATAHLDLKYQSTVLGLVRGLARDGLVVVAAMHDLNLAAQYADRLALLRAGRLLVCDTPPRVLTSDWLRQGYDIEATVLRHPVYSTPIVTLVPAGTDT